MAHSPIVGTGISFAAVAAGTVSTSFAIKSPYLRITPRTAGVHVAFSQTAATVTTDEGGYYIPSGTSETLAMSRYSQKIVGITIGATTVLTCPEGQQMPFNVGNLVRLVCPITSSNGDIVNQYNFTAQVTAIDNTASTYDGTFQTKVTVDAVTTGVSTAWTASNGRADTVLYSAGRLIAKTDGASTDVNIIQVQTAGDA
jgi:hypothetical protein|tara:strand:- start:21 stop:617 length:597 start_codon:yes stop_codon:yes gene_type:complete